MPRRKPDEPPARYGPKPQPRFDVTPVWKIITERYETIVEFSNVHKVHQADVYRWRRYGMTMFKADQVACELGYHPVELWPDWFSVQ